jgi:hypothetical protein
LKKNAHFLSKLFLKACLEIRYRRNAAILTAVSAALPAGDHR